MFFEYSYFIILFCAIRVFIFLRRRSLLVPAQDKRIQMQLFATIVVQVCFKCTALCYTFVLQALIPFFAYYFQFVVTRVVYRFEFSAHLAKDLLYKSMFTSYSVIPLLNPLAAILLISSYRRTLIRVLTRRVGMIYIERNVESDSNRQEDKPGTTLWLFNWSVLKLIGQMKNFWS